MRKYCSLIPYYMYMYSMYIYIYTLYGIQDPGPWIHVTAYTDPYPVPQALFTTSKQPSVRVCIGGKAYDKKSSSFGAGPAMV